MKKLLLLGGSAQQIVAINKAKELGYYTILCDYLPDNPGKNYADKFYQESTTDIEKILQISMQEKIDGIVAYASDPAALTASYVAQEMDLPGNPLESVKILTNKDLFRQFLVKNNFNSPKSIGFKDPLEAIKSIEIFKFPIIIKPVDSSGSKGVTVLNSQANAEKAVEYAFTYSRSKKIIIEEYIEKKHKYLIGGDIFVLDGMIVLDGLMNCHRDNEVNNLVPVGKSFPLDISDLDKKKVLGELLRLVKLLNIKNSPLNVELIIDKDDEVWFIDIGPRNGGNMIPELMGDIYSLDIVEKTLRLALGEQTNIKSNKTAEFIASHNLHSSRNGKLREIIIKDELKEYIYKKNIFLSPGDDVQYFENSTKAIGVIFMKFDSKDNMFRILNNINEYYTIEIE